MARRAPASRAARGVTLLEVLVAILVLSIGLLGVAGMQAASLRYAQGGWVRAGLASGVSSLAERVRANPAAAADAYRLADEYATQRSDIDSGKVQAVVTANNCLASTCTPAQLAAFDLATWRLALDTAMPGSGGFVQGDAVAGYQATILWKDKAYADDTDPTALKRAADKDCSGSETGLAQRSCCPAAAKAPDGVRCTNFTVIP